MANFEYTRPGGVWPDLAGVGAEDLADLDLKTALAISGEGGVYAPTTQIEIGGQGINITGPTQVADLTVNGNLFVPNGGEVDGDFVLRGDYFTVDGGLTTLGGLLEVVGIATFDAAMAVLGVADFNANASGVSLRTAQGIIVGGATSRFDGAVNIIGLLGASNFDASGEAVAIGQAEVGGLVTLRSPMRGSGFGRYAGKSIIATDDRDGVVYTPALYQNLIIPQTLFTTSRTIVISDTNCVDYDEFTVTNNGFTNPCFVQLPAGNVVNVVAYHWATFKRTNGSWDRITGGSFNIHSVTD